MPLRTAFVPKYARVREALLERILGGSLPPGGQIPTEDELGVEFRVSKPTVRQALAYLADEGYLVKVHGKGSFVSEVLPAADAMQVEMFFGKDLSPFGDLIFAEVCGAIAQSVQYRGGALGVSNYHEEFSREGYLSQLLGRDPEGLIAVANVADWLIEPLMGRMPVVGVSGVPGELPIDWAVADNRGAAAEAVSILAAQGHKRIGFVHGGTDLCVTGERLAGYRECLEANSLPFDVRWIIDHEDVPDCFRVADDRCPSLWVDSRLLSLPVAERPTAVVCAGDGHGLNVCEAARRAGLVVPDDLSVIGLDDSPRGIECSPPLTVVKTMTDCIGREAVELLERRIGGDIGPPRVAMGEFRVIMRQSVCKPAG